VKTPNASHSDDGTDDLADAFLASEQMDETAAYLQRGRHLAHTSIDQLTDQWVAAFRALPVDPSEETRREFSDLEAEFRMRELPPPAHLVGSELDAAVLEIAKSDPEPEWLMEKIAAFLRSRENPSG
jgi:hypothetical protein